MIVYRRHWPAASSTPFWVVCLVCLDLAAPLAHLSPARSITLPIAASTAAESSPPSLRPVPLDPVPVLFSIGLPTVKLVIDDWNGL